MVGLFVAFVGIRPKEENDDWRGVDAPAFRWDKKGVGFDF